MSDAFICPDNTDEAIKYIAELKKIEGGDVDDDEKKIIHAFVDEAVRLVDRIK